MPLLDHLIELRNRLMWAIGAVLVAFLICYQFKERIYGFLVHPLAVIFEGQTGRHLIYTGLTEAFFTYVKVSFWAGLCLAFPIVASQIWKFVAPGLYKNERRAFYPYLFATPVLVRDGRVARLFCRDPGRLALLRQLRDAGRRRRRTSDRPRGEGQRIPVVGDDPALRLWRRLSAAGAADPDGAGRVWLLRPGSHPNDAMRLSSCSSSPRC